MRKAYFNNKLNIFLATIDYDGETYKVQFDPDDKDDTGEIFEFKTKSEIDKFFAERKKMLAIW
jgi:hypothetical protein